MIPVYRNDSYLRSLDTVLDQVSEDDAYQLLTCREAIFAEGGGQPRDYGTVTVRGEVRTVLDLVKHKGDIRLRVERIGGIEKGDPIVCEIDFDRRYRIMRLHTAQHALAASVRKVIADYQTAGMRIDEPANTCTMNFLSAIEAPEKAVQDALPGLEHVIREGRGVHADQLESIDLAVGKYGALFRPGDPAVKIKGRVRMIVIEGLDANACGGTHLRNTEEIKGVRLLSVTKGDQQNVNHVSFELGSR